MPTTKPRSMITFNDKELYERVNSYRFEHRFKSQNDAVMDLINKGIETLLSDAPTKQTIELTDEQLHVIDLYNNTDPIYQGVAVKIMEDNQISIKERRA